jgi:sulfate adenylyltransferase subunit 1
MGARETFLAAGNGLLRFIASGSVDDGKSTLIGRMLYDAKGVFEDQLTAVAGASRRRGRGDLDLSLLTDGLVAEREQGITIDVAYRYFATAQRKFIIADTPGHVQYTRNMVTAASTADLAVVLIDARNGVLTQTRRHVYLANLLRIPHLLFAINKMDLVGFDAGRFDALAADLMQFASRLDFASVACIPVCALDGDNVVYASQRMPWYDGPTVLQRLESAPACEDRIALPFRFPVQGVLRPTGTAAGTKWHDLRGLTGRVESGRIAVGDKVVVQPAGRATSIADIRTFGGSRTCALAGESVVLELADNVDVSRGDVLSDAKAPALASSSFLATVCWLAHEPLDRTRRLLVKSGTRTAKAKIATLEACIDVDTLHEQLSPAALHENDIGRVHIRAAQLLAIDRYRDNRATGSFVLIDEATNDTVAAGMVLSPPTVIRSTADP